MAQDPNAKNNKPSNKQPNKQPRQINIITIVVFALVAIFFFSMLTRMPQGSSDGITQTDSLVTSEFTQAVDQGRVESVVYDAGAETISGVYYPAQTAGVTAANAFNTGIEALNSQLGTIVNGGSRLETIEPSILQVKTLGSKHNFTCTWVGQDTLGQLMAAHPEIKYSITLPSPWGSILLSLLPILIIAGLLFFFFSQMNKANNSQMSFGKAKAKKSVEEHPDVHFSDVAGVDEAVEEMQEIKDFLDNPAKYQAMGAKIPRGCLLVGPPGTGKTLLARAVAGEAGVPFFSISGSDFVEMDGFEANDSVVLIAATNRADVLDPALLRPGRFDRQIVVDVPDVKGREKILKVHAENKPLAKDVNLPRLAKITPGFTGADLANLLNEAAILSARRNKHIISEQEVTESMERVIAGPERKGRVLDENTRKTISYHESGHALVGHLLPHADPVHKISIISRGRALGYTLSIPDEDKVLNSRNEMRDELAVFLGGRVAEEIFCEDITTGASNDLERATKMARSMVTNYGMSSDLGVQVFGQPNHEVFLGRDYGNTQDYSEETARRIDEEVARIMREAHDRAYEILSSHKEQMDLMSAVLLERETVDGEACTALLDNKWADYLKLEASGAVEKAANTLASKEPEQEAPASAAPQPTPAQPAAPSAPASPASNEVQTSAQNGAAAPQAPAAPQEPAAPTAPSAPATPAAPSEPSASDANKGFLDSLEQKIKDMQDGQDAEDKHDDSAGKPRE
ncbi:MAG: AAA family ATPase [Eggerthella sp.]|nr:AAA family ATPase [Eggerthella sp.]